MPTTMPMEARTIRKYSTWFTLYGIALIVLGALAIVAPGLATLAASILIGWLLLVSGAFGVAAVAAAGTSQPGFGWKLLTTTLYLVAGILLLWNPVGATITLTLVLAAYLLATGVAKLIVAFGYRNAIPGAWIWMLLSAIIDIVLGVMIVADLPGSASWVLGLIVGINLLATGVALAIAANCCRGMAATGGGV